MPKREDVLKRFNSLLKDRKKLDREDIIAARKFLREARKAILDKAKTIDQWNAQIMQGEINRMLNFYNRQFEIIAEGAMLRGATEGAESTVGLYREDLGPDMGIRQQQIGENLPQISRTVFEIQLRQRGELIKGVFDAERKSIMHQVRQVGVGLVSPSRAVTNIANTIGSVSDGKVFRRASLILRQETAVANNAATQIVQERTQKITGVKLLRTWRHVKDGRVRKTHRKAQVDYAEGSIAGPGPIPIDKKFHVGDAWLRFPADPASPILKETMNCRCQAVPLKIPISEVKPSGMERLEVKI